MVMETTSILLALSCLVLAALFLKGAWKILNWVWLKPKKLEKLLKEQGIQGNSYKFLYGDLKENLEILRLAESKPINLSDDILPRVLPYVNQSVKQHGKNSFMWYGPVPRLNIMDPELVREVFTKMDDFHKTVPNPLVKCLSTGLTAYEGDKWTKHRKIINPAFHILKLKNMFPAFCQSCCEMISSWESLPWVDGSCELDVWPFLQNLTGDVISRTAFGSNYEEARRILELIRQLAIILTQVLQLVYIPGWRFLPTKTNKKIRKMNSEVEALLRGIIRKREGGLKNGEAGADDLLGLLLESNLKQVKEHGNDKLGMSIQDVIRECKLFYFAGQETTSVLLVWTLVLLSKHQDWQQKAREEVLQAFGTDKPDFEGLNNLKIMTMIFNEVLRLYPSVVALTRRVGEDVKLGNYTLPAGVLISLPIMLIHRDPDLWGEDAKEFNPERFAEGVSKATNNKVCFFPFGWGPRTCIGIHFAMVEAKLALSLILQKYAFELSPSYAHAPFQVVTMQPQHGVELVLRKL